MCVRLLLNIIKQSGKIKRCKVVLRGLCAADHALTEPSSQSSSSAERSFAVIVIAHRRSHARRCRGYKRNRRCRSCGSIAVNGKLVVIFAQTAGHVVGMIAQRVFLAEHGDMVVCAVHRRTHEVRRAGVQTGILLIGMLLVDGTGQPERRKGQVIKRPISVKMATSPMPAGTRTSSNFLTHALTDGHDVVLGSCDGAVRDAYAAGQVDVVRYARRSPSARRTASWNRMPASSG